MPMAIGIPVNRQMSLRRSRSINIRIPAFPTTASVTGWNAGVVNSYLLGISGGIHVVIAGIWRWVSAADMVSAARILAAAVAWIAREGTAVDLTAAVEETVAELIVVEQIVVEQIAADAGRWVSIRLSKGKSAHAW